MSTKRNSRNNFKLVPEFKEKVKNKVSETKPNQVRSLKEMVERYEQGNMQMMGADQSRMLWPDRNVTFDDVDLEKLRQMDLFDASEVVKAKRVLWDAAQKRLFELQKEQQEEREKPKVSRVGNDEVDTESGEVLRAKPVVKPKPPKDAPRRTHQ